MPTDTFSTSAKVTGKKQALADIYERHSTELYRYACRLLSDPDLAEDCVSETFSRFLLATRTGKMPGNTRAYLFRMVHNWTTDHFRHQPLASLSIQDDLHASPEADPASQAAWEMDRRQVRAALLRLPPEQRQVIELRFLEDWPHEQVAETIGKTVEATRKLQQRALSSLRQILMQPLADQQEAQI